MRLQNPVVLVGEDEQLSINASHFGGVKGCECLVGKNAVVLLAVNAQNRSIPFIHKLVGTVGKCTLGNFVVFLPVSAAHIPVGEPFLLGLQVLHLHIEDTIVGDKGLEAFVVMTGYPIDAETAERRANATQAILIYVGQVLYSLVDSCEIIAHTLSAVVAADFLVPCFAKTGQTATVGGYHYVAVGCHLHEVPAVAPELADGTLRTTFAIEQGGVFLGGVEMGRKHNPGQHLFAVRSGLPARNDRSHRHLVVDILILKGQLLTIAIQLIGFAHRVTQVVQVVINICHRHIVVLPVCQFLAFALQVRAVDMHRGVPYGGIYNVCIICPEIGVHIRVDAFAQIGLLAARQVHDEQAVLVALVAVTLHRLPCDIFAVGRVGWIDVIAHHTFRQIRMRARAYVIYIYVTIGRNGILQTGFLAAGIGNLFVIGVPCQLFHAAERLHWAFKCRAIQDVDTFTHLG